MNGERTQCDYTVEAKSAANGRAVADREGELAVRRKAMFDLLRKGGYDSVEVEYEGGRGIYQAVLMAFHKGKMTLTHNRVPAEVCQAYVAERIPVEQVYTSYCDGSARIYTASGYTCFRQYAETKDCFWDGNEPGAEVPEEDIYPRPEEEEFAEYHGCSLGCDCDCGNEA